MVIYTKLNGSKPFISQIHNDESNSVLSTHTHTHRSKPTIIFPSLLFSLSLPNSLRSTSFTLATSNPEHSNRLSKIKIDTLRLAVGYENITNPMTGRAGDPAIASDRFELNVDENIFLAFSQTEELRPTEKIIFVICDTSFLMLFLEDRESLLVFA